MSAHRSGFVSIAGRPNAGKSTLLNALVGQKLAIVADKPQTTRTSIQGVLSEPGAQAVFLDTPGIHRSDNPLNRRMMEAVRAALDGRDLLLYVADASAPFAEDDAQAVDILRRAETPIFLVANKIDRVKDKNRLLPVLERYRELFPFEAYVPVSALTGENLPELKRLILERLPEGPAYFPEDYVTDQPERFLAAELIREQILLGTRQEVPHASAVMVDKWEETEKLTRILATVYVEREGQKKIVIGQGGAMLKAVGTAARREIETLLGRKVYLELFVKVRPRWRDSEPFLNELDWRSMAGLGSTEE
ncbi:MAG TPA: GTPase Era [Solibacterales bacterium]|nr:GTPase Era [Bryobacterales bacterium]